jgi:hypothetical protein
MIFLFVDLAFPKGLIPGFSLVIVLEDYELVADFEEEIKPTAPAKRKTKVA